MQGQSTANLLYHVMPLIVKEGMTSEFASTRKGSVNLVRIQRIAQAVTDKVDGDGGDKDHEPGK